MLAAVDARLRPADESVVPAAFLEGSAEGGGDGWAEALHGGARYVAGPCGQLLVTEAICELQVEMIVHEVR
eukprot:CAMPEP_0174708896 /NCGR_PEP_ID=MMETSP1094-20130205/11021_1 /TAXON_ID=156173 /ORGANISM="Chrysochromulina brevifilum, Strain UTEX LB 985" /LENGTH=70 /DNA_ID=CAMNT_0015907513 /DNA_START=116 /DNA_END=328 /DNA_ORIENTATION=+